MIVTMNLLFNLFPLSIQMCILEYYNPYKKKFNDVIIVLKWNNFVLADIEFPFC